MCVSRNNNRLFIAIVLGMFLVSGCSGHSVKYGANSEGDGLSSEEEATGFVDGATSGTARSAEGSTMHGGTVNGSDPFLKSGQGLSNMSGSEISKMDGVGSTSDYGRQFGGVNKSGPNHGPVSGFGSGSAKASNPDPETWANAYLREKRSSQGFYGDPSATGSLSGQDDVGALGGGPSTARSSYGHDYAGVPGSGPNHGAVGGFNQGSASQSEVNPEKWAKAYLNENGGVPPEYVNPDMMDIAKSKGNENFGSMGMGDSTGEFLEITKTSGGEGRVQDIYFSFDSWSISAEGAKYLEEDAKWLAANPDKSLTIEGHADQRGTQDYNLVLGKKRAEAAREFLVTLGVQPHRINIVSYGKERPFCQKDNEDCFQKNRRNHMVVRINQS